MLILPFTSEFMERALIGGSLVAVICAIAGTWVVIRGMAFLGEAIGHGMLPGVALATVLGLPVMLGAAASAVVMTGLLGAMQRKGKLSYDTSIGLVFVGMLSLGIIIVSHSRSFATDATSMLFGDILAINTADLWLLAGALLLSVAIAVKFHRAFVASAFDTRIALTLGFKPGLAQIMLVLLVALSITASFRSVGTLLVVGMLLAPVVAAKVWVARIPAIMILAAVFGVLSVSGGLLISWYAQTAAGPSISCLAISLAGISALIQKLLSTHKCMPETTHNKSLLHVESAT
ncbi:MULTISPECIES: zinc ABC transporter permease AztB [Micrococcaceae]|uniref:zinc ABC transporter permease AztB n=1 Tax=Micrococcaceae TaxID=1268 RepID=UPI001F5F5B63|nr:MULTISPECIES: zinc ABC transporter permease AztB [Micrococcaceae]UXN32908.1 zinc ABC transporter permease AztB [Glutamicibacter sp. M10]